jgi:hypothetical protein
MTAAIFRSFIFMIFLRDRLSENLISWRVAREFFETPHYTKRVLLVKEYARREASGGRFSFAKPREITV